MAEPGSDQMAEVSSISSFSGGNPQIPIPVFVAVFRDVGALAFTGLLTLGRVPQMPISVLVLLLIFLNVCVLKGKGIPT